MKIKPTATRRNVFIDIETVTLDSKDDKGALSAVTGRIVCICLLIDDGSTIREEMLIDHDERTLLEAFWAEVKPHDVFIGYNALDFDLPFIRQRSWILGVRPSRRISLKRYYTEDVIDLMQLWSNWSAAKNVSLDTLGAALGCGGKTGHASDVSDWWAHGELEQIAAYCREDVRLTFRVFNRLMFQPLPDRYLNAVANAAEIVPPSSEGSHLAKILVFPGPQR